MHLYFVNVNKGTPSEIKLIDRPITDMILMIHSVELQNKYRIYNLSGKQKQEKEKLGTIFRKTFNYKIYLRMLQREIPTIATSSLKYSFFSHTI